MVTPSTKPSWLVLVLGLVCGRLIITIYKSNEIMSVLNFGDTGLGCRVDCDPTAWMSLQPSRLVISFDATKRTSFGRPSNNGNLGPCQPYQVVIVLPEAYWPHLGHDEYSEISCEILSSKSQRSVRLPPYFHFPDTGSIKSSPYLKLARQYSLD